MFDKREMLNTTEYWVYYSKQIIENNQEYWTKEVMKNSSCKVFTVLQKNRGKKHLP